jgi:hypothetical protein
VQYASGRRLERLHQQEAVVEMILRGSQDVDSPFGGNTSVGAGQRLASSLFSSEMLRVLAEAKDGKVNR